MIVLLFPYAGRVPNDTEFRGLLAYHIIPGLYNTDTPLAPNYPANNTVDTELGAILGANLPQRVNFTAFSNSTDSTPVRCSCSF